MNWTTRYGYDDIFDYPEYFRVYMNTHNGTSTLDALEEKFLIVDGWDFVQSVGLTAFVNELPVTPAPTLSPTVAQSISTESPTAPPIEGNAGLATMATASVMESPSEMPSRELVRHQPRRSMSQSGNPSPTARWSAPSGSGKA